MKTEATKRRRLLLLILSVLMFIASSKNDEKSNIPLVIETNACENGTTATNNKSDAKNQEKFDFSLSVNCIKQVYKITFFKKVYCQ